MPKIIIKQSIQKDAWNWWAACNKISYGTDWKERISKALQNKIVGQPKKVAFKFLIPFLKDLYKREKINARKKEIQDIFLRKQKKIFRRMTQVTGKRIYHKDFICFLTTFQRAPYDYYRGYIWIPIVWPKETYIRTFVHELLHFQTYAYWQKRCLRNLTNKEFENLKEALTVILNTEFLDLMIWFDKGYKIHENFRKKLLKFWLKNKNFDKLVDYGIKIYPRDLKE